MSKPTIEGSDGSTPESALSIRAATKEHLLYDELYWVHRYHWSPSKPGQSPADSGRTGDEFRSNTTHETKRIGRNVYDIVTVSLPDGKKQTIYFDVTQQRFYWPREK